MELASRLRDGLARLKSSEHVFMILIAVVIGLGGGLTAVVLRWLIHAVQWVSFGHLNPTLAHLHRMEWYWILLIPAVGGLFVGPLVFRVAHEAKGHGVPEVMEAVAIRGGVIRPRVVIVKALATAICIGSGGSTGREGPIVQIGSAFGSTLGQWFRVSARRVRTMVACGAAAGIAGAFNAPIAGALFAVEIILGDFGVTHFSPIVISSVVSTVVSRYFLGDMPAFTVPRYELVSGFELLPYALLGLVAAVVGVGFIRLLYYVEDLFDRASSPNILKPAVGGLVVGGIAVAFPHVLGIGYESIEAAVEGQLAWHLALVLILAKLLATSVTLGSGGSGGIFAPSLFLGAMTGASLGAVIHQLLPGITAGPGAYALVGMGAVVAATTHAPLTAMIIIFELTGDYKIIAPLMAACVIAVLLAMRLHHSSIYTEKLVRKGIQLFEPFEVNILRRLPVSSVITRQPETVRENTKFEELVKLAVNSPHSEFFVVRDGREYVGTISVHQLRQILLDREWLEQLIIARDLADPTYPSLRPDDNLDLALKLFARQNVEELPVVENGKLVGSVHKSDVLEVYNREILRRDLTSGMHGVLSWVERAKFVDLGEGYVLANVEVPPHFVGKTLRELDLRATHGVEVILIKKRHSAGNSTCVPTPDYELQSGDVLLVAGTSEQVKRLAQ